MTVGELKNVAHKYTSGTDSTLRITLQRGKKNWVVTVRQKMDDGKTKTGCRAYFDLSGEEDKIHAEVERLMAEAKTAGWVLADTKQTSTGGFTSIPPAPGAKKGAAADQLAKPAAANKR